ncbi:hypothetical protein Daura_01715 [Dactylosporangium aurantiacum]|uniref:Uncharacterized protein n=1 Tax=Dactylosporangium aurantiacum TaxID=35754 RepID=A0A9Q9MG00_9ACTN|nr:hypothetical protein [Dactylosporangium aurantiacum]MDG6100917.1 hypothetical protein [Dactylosporangium aurantiacum]UWZ55029.1 hypothetical protein Daura_01715 [Dactylosporangium aurantiacum]
MTERDPLRTRFDAFRDQSVRAASAPPVEEIPRRLRRTRRRRTVAAVVAAIAVVAVVTLPSWSRGGPPPIPATSPTPSPTPSASVSLQAAPPAGTASSPSSAASSPSRTAACGTSARGLPLLADGRTEAQLTVNGSNALVPVPANIFEVCPAARIPFAHVTWGWDVNRQQYVQVYNASSALTRTQPSVPKPSAYSGMNSCGVVDVLVAGTRPAPSSIPRSVQDGPEPSPTFINSMMKNNQVMVYLSVVYSNAELATRSFCQPTSPTA